MARLETLNESRLQPETLAALEAARMNGKLAPVYLQFANSEPAIRAYLAMEQALKAGALSARELECIKLLVSQLTQCEFCLSVHTMKATALGVSAETQRQLRLGEGVGEPRLDAILAIVKAFFQQPGVIDDARLQSARDAGVSDAELVDVCMACSTIFFTNITNHINDTPVTLPPAPALD